MRVSSPLPALGLLLSTVMALPGKPLAPTLVARASAPANPTDAWVTIDASGQPSTVTPVATTIDGTPTVISAAPYDATGTVFTETSYGELTTSTGLAVAAATATSGAGSFLECHNAAGGPMAPFCLPANNQTLYPGQTYYVTWDPTYFSGANTTVQVVGWYVNGTTSVLTSQAFSSGYVAAAWGFYQWALDTSVLSSQGVNGINVTIMMAAWAQNAPSSAWLVGPTVLVTYTPTYQQPPAKPPTGPALYIGLPVVLGFVALTLLGTCLWNRRSRHIGLGNIMSRGRDGYGVGKSRSQRVRREQRAEQKIHLMEREPRPEPALDYDDGRHYEPPTLKEYRDVPRWRAQVEDEEEDAGVFGTKWNPGGERDGGALTIDIPRRDSDALGSLVGTPTEQRRMDFPLPGPGAGEANTFRDEMERQQRAREGSF